MTAFEIRTLSQSHLIEIGAHTMTHPRLPRLAENDKRDEILEGISQLMNLTGRKPKTFSFPFGQWDSVSLEIVEKSFDYAVVTRPDKVTPSTPRHRLNRFAVENWSQEEFKSRIQSWCSRA